MSEHAIVQYRSRGRDFVERRPTLSSEACSAFSPRCRPFRDALVGTMAWPFAHAALTDVPIGAWTAGVVEPRWTARVDGGCTGRAPTIVLKVGLAGALAAALTGLADWSATPRGPRRSGLRTTLGPKWGDCRPCMRLPLFRRTRGSRKVGSPYRHIGLRPCLLSACWARRTMGRVRGTSPKQMLERNRHGPGKGRSSFHLIRSGAVCKADPAAPQRWSDLDTRGSSVTVRDASLLMVTKGSSAAAKRSGPSWSSCSEVSPKNRARASGQLTFSESTPCFKPLLSMAHSPLRPVRTRCRIVLVRATKTIDGTASLVWSTFMRRGSALGRAVRDKAHARHGIKNDGPSERL